MWRFGWVRLINHACREAEPIASTRMRQMQLAINACLGHDQTIDHKVKLTCDNTEIRGVGEKVIVFIPIVEHQGDDSSSAHGIRLDN